MCIHRREKEMNDLIVQKLHEIEQKEQINILLTVYQGA